MSLVEKNTPANGGDIRDVGSIPELGRSFGGGHGNPFQCSCLENPVDRGAWQATVHAVTESRTRLKRLAQHSLFFTHSSADGHLGGFHVLGVINSASVSIGVLASFHIRVCLFSGCVPESGIAGSHGSSIFSL